MQTWTQRIRIITGLVIYIYVLTHLLNHAVGILGLVPLEIARSHFLGFWRSPAMFLVLPLSLLFHIFTALWFMYHKHTFRGMSFGQYVQYAFGLLTPIFLLGHIIATRVAHTLYDINDTYVAYLIETRPMKMQMVLLTVMLILAWSHGSIGIYYFLRIKRSFRHFQPFFMIFSFLLPVLATMGILSASKDVSQLLKIRPSWQQQVSQLTNPQNIAWSEMTNKNYPIVLYSYLGVLVIIFASRQIRVWSKKKKAIKVSYSDGQEVMTYINANLLETSLSGNIPHAHICGSKGRCTTCRVQIIKGEENLSEIGDLEKESLKKMNAGEATLRLACQTYAKGDVTIYPILSADITMDGLSNSRYNQGEEKDVSVLFADLRSFTRFSENRLPYDLVFVLNQYFKAMGEAIESSHGYLDKFVGDGTMAIFGIEDGNHCQAALNAAMEMFANLESLNERLADEIQEPLRMGVGIHTGSVVIGKIGYKHASNLTAFGDVVNTASRLEASTKEYKAEMVISEAVALNSGFDFSNIHKNKIALRGKDQSINVYVVSKVGDLKIVPQTSPPEVESIPSKEEAGETFSGEKEEILPEFVLPKDGVKEEILEPAPSDQKEKTPEKTKEEEKSENQKKIEAAMNLDLSEIANFK